MKQLMPQEALGTSTDSDFELTCGPCQYQTPAVEREDMGSFDVAMLIRWNVLAEIKWSTTSYQVLAGMYIWAFILNSGEAQANDSSR